ncbi:MAG: hypothetical protein ACD_19C00014G0002 [uncultured bacterium]|nr:MAG: hypothetical protein ACD_19C00014G0002 [uncultured bacterium]
MILDFLFPKYCLECKKPGKYICDLCISKVTPCGTCGKVGDNYSIFKYEGVIRKAIISLKYKFAYDLGDELTSRVLRVIKTNPKFNDPKLVIVPIPLYKTRENWRGFNQSGLIGEKLAKAMNWNYIPDLLIRNKNTAPQVGLKGSIRRSNLSNVFAVCSPYIQYTKYDILVFDDVYTTGSTINEAKKVLKEARFKKVYSLTIAR